MLHVPPSVAIYVYTRHADLRKGFDGLSGIIRQEFQADPLDGSLFLFFNRRRDRLKILHFDGTGYWLYYKKLESHYPHLLLFTEIASSSDNLARRLAAAAGMDSIPPRIARRRPMPEEITAIAPPRAQFSAGP